MFYLFFLLSLPAELDVFSLITVSDPKTLNLLLTIVERSRLFVGFNLTCHLTLRALICIHCMVRNFLVFCLFTLCETYSSKTNIHPESESVKDIHHYSRHLLFGE